MTTSLRGRHPAKPSRAHRRYTRMYGGKAPAIGLLAATSSVLAIIAAGCGGSSQSGGLPRATGVRLAKQSDQIAALLARGDRCGAARAAANLRAGAERAAASGQVPQTISLELERRVRALASSITCVPPPPAQPRPAPSYPAPGDRGDGEGEGGGD